MPAVGQNIPHDSAPGHVTGESQFLDDLPPARNEVYVDTVGSPVARGTITSIDLAAARAIPGVVAIFTAADIPGHNHIGPVLKDEHLLAEREVYFLGDPIVLIAAESRAALCDAKHAVKIEVAPETPIFTIDQAIAANSFLTPPRIIQRGNLDEAFATARHTLQGTLEIGGQDHFYLESQIAIAYPSESSTITVHSSTQHPSEVQMTIAEVLGVPLNKVTVICKRMGGAFGGKETQAVQPAAMAALVASKLRRPARLLLTKDDDMRFTGKRHPFKSIYKAAFTDDGIITALDVQLYSNGGWSLDLSMAVLERAMLHTDNAYFIENFRVTGRVCKTNLPSNTAFRGFGGPQGVLSTENIIEEIALKLGIDALEVRKRNVYGAPPIANRKSQIANDTTPYGQIVRNNTLPKLFEELTRSADYHRRRDDIILFNSRSKTELRGISMTAVKFGISFTHRTLNQANALVNIYQDGTVLVATGGTEMGQGVNTRIRQLVADDLGIPYTDVLVAATNTDKNHNTSPTAASSGTDLNGAAALDATGRLRQRLATFASKLLTDQSTGQDADTTFITFADGNIFDSRVPEKRISFKDLICHAYLDRINLGERGFYIIPGVSYNRDTGRGQPFFYFTNGVAAAEVLVDRFTGDNRVLRVDLLMDIGESINPGIDRGQITGGFIQGLGWCTTEELMYHPSTGELWSHSPTTYKIPNISDLPEIFNIATLHNPDNTISLKRSKATGEPPLLLGICVWTAIKNALSYATPNQIPQLKLPATNEHVLACIARSPSLVTAV